MPRTTSFRSAVYAGFTLAILSALALGLLTWWAAWQSQQAADYVRNSRQVLQTLTATEASFNRAEAAQRGYINLRRQSFVDERDDAIEALTGHLTLLSRAPLGGAAQERRLEALRSALDDRLQAYRELQALYDAGKPVVLEDRLVASQRLLGRIRSLLGEMEGELRADLARHEASAERQSDIARALFLVFGLALVALLGLMFWRVRSDLLARGQAEQEARHERELNGLHARALTLFNAKPDRKSVLEGTLALLAEAADRLFPVSVFYALDEWGTLRMVAGHGTPSDAKGLLDAHEGPLGHAALSGQMVRLDGLEGAGHGGGLRIETGLATLRPAELLMAPVAYQGRRLGVMVLGAARTLTERDLQFVERLAAQLGVALNNLAQLDGLNLLTSELRERGEDIQRKNEQLELASRLKSEFVASMSHELRTPLNAVIGFSEILRDGLVGPLAPQQRQYVNDIYESGRHLLALINDILDLSKIEAGQMELQLGPEQPATLAASGLSVVRERAATRRIELRADLPEDLGSVVLDSRRTLQIIFNLLSNAVKFTAEGGLVQLSMARVTREEAMARATTEHSRVFPPAGAVTAHYLQIRVSDTGIGIAPEALRELFQPFRQVDSSLSKRYEGTGLGLTMTQRLVELHGGGLELHSRPGEGSTFTVWLPWREPAARADEPPPVAPPSEPAQPEAGRGDARGDGAARILVIEDEAAAARVMRLQLESHGYQVQVSPDAENGLVAARQWRPDAIVLDVILPGMDGWDVLSQLKEEAATQRIPVVIVSVTDEPRRGFALGASQVLVKPVERDDLLAALSSMGIAMTSRPGQVLVVDDDPKAVTLVTTHLEAAGFRPSCAFSGEEALSIVRRERPDLIILDLMMPHMTGFEVLDALARRPETAGIAIVVLTAKLVTDADREALRGRVQAVLEKAEFQPNQLVAEVRRALHRRQLGHEGAV
ncbi:response regulator [Aquincola tertiaricarbonis]|uniref:histidine kinase n=1 Tax=Aquincola tertiaricarbonis TaxID=391953 RepID=A0ABY4RZ09_AQUTE|nr:response regulator [Aquincola tertiaricarbonis]URI06091.1 response regulator [Aquincola tertiaricarbonis]